MARPMPAVVNGSLVGLSEGPIGIDTSAWFAWLEGAVAFHVRLEEGHFGARKERAGHGRGACYWRGYRRKSGRLVRAYLGASTDLTLARLREAAAQLGQPVEASRRQARSSARIAARGELGRPNRQRNLVSEKNPSEPLPAQRLRLLGDSH
jgi:LuxR family maltose regulon positive regulatory protein